MSVQKRYLKEWGSTGRDIWWSNNVLYPVYLRRKEDSVSWLSWHCMLCQGCQPDNLQEKLGIHVGDCTEDGKFSLEACRCIGACGLAPVIMINDDVYGRLTPDDVEGVLEKYKDL